MCPTQTATELVIQLNSAVSEILNEQFLAKSKRVIARSSNPWYNLDISAARRLHSQLESHDDAAIYLSSHQIQAPLLYYS